jgi:hypothetical protein
MPPGFNSTRPINGLINAVPVHTVAMSAIGICNDES